MAKLAPTQTDLAPLAPEYFGHGRRRRKLAAAGWDALALLCVIAMLAGAMLGGGALADEPGGPILGGLAGLLLGTVIGLAMAKSMIRAKRLRAPSALDILARDRRPPVVYLRPFTADTDASKPVALTSWYTEEEQLAKMMSDLGPFVAIGAPEEKLPSLGAARLYVDDPKWQEAVLDLVERAAVIIIRIGNSPGFWWEFESVMRRTGPEKLVLLIPRNEALYEQFRIASRKLIPTVLPALTGWEVKKRFRGHLKSVIFFDAGWVPSIVDVQTYRLPFLRRSPAMPLVPVLQMALRPLYESAGLRWAAPPINARMLLLIGAVALFIFTQALAWSIDGGPRYALDPSPVTLSESPAFVPVQKSKVEIATERMSNRFSEVPELVSRFETVSQAADPGPEGRARTQQAMRSLGAQLAQLGMKRLDDDALLTMSDLRTKLIIQADIAGCAAFARGNPGAHLMPMLETLDAAEVDQFFEILYAATVAEARQSPAPRQADETRLQATMSVILDDLPPHERERLRSDLTTTTGLDDGEACWMGRTLHAGIARLDRADRVHWMLAQ